MILEEVRVRHEADIQAAESQARQQARIPGPDGHEGRAGDPEPPPASGPSCSRLGDSRSRSIVPGFMARSCPAQGKGVDFSGTSLRSGAVRSAGLEDRELFLTGERGIDCRIGSSSSPSPRVWRFPQSGCGGAHARTATPSWSRQPPAAGASGNRTARDPSQAEGCGLNLDFLAPGTERRRHDAVRVTPRRDWRRYTEELFRSMDAWVLIRFYRKGNVPFSHPVVPVQPPPGSAYAQEAIRAHGSLREGMAWPRRDCVVHPLGWVGILIPVPTKTHSDRLPGRTRNTGRLLLPGSDELTVSTGRMRHRTAIFLRHRAHWSGGAGEGPMCSFPPHPAIPQRCPRRGGARGGFPEAGTPSATGSPRRPPGGRASDDPLSPAR